MRQEHLRRGLLDSGRRETCTGLGLDTRSTTGRQAAGPQGHRARREAEGDGSRTWRPLPVQVGRPSTRAPRGHDADDAKS